ncbi:hypothetical protein SDRG_01463 [Saprolegnia diclina VS20]|uniref:Uncharacterized protein n=1 Tax=Saprolegnia diclina (strain VS20) TaxID=1156394 RepID=T0R3H8_SAPDV|nr:hypothetical protein SDRG_01463 [Saprolegnia diclina VS20]EQC41496.1 hypothetical protein SDRG_01463 [Saprolegnia diclina VS20]|eukprot:XP_008605210.1 hypothetical protein SDRG_01463 [Saprolegnia diclina VS20]
MLPAPKLITCKNPTASLAIERIRLVVGDKMRASGIESVEDFCSAVGFATRASFQSTKTFTLSAATFGRNMLFNFEHLTDWAAAHKRSIQRIAATMNTRTKAALTMALRLQGDVQPLAQHAEQDVAGHCRALWDCPSTPTVT